MAGAVPVKCMRKVFSTFVDDNLKMMMKMMMKKYRVIDQGCGKCLFCLKISALCECTEEDKVISVDLFRYIVHCTGRPKKLPIECCLKHGAQARTPVAGTPCVWKNVFFWSFHNKTKQNQALPNHVHGENWPHSTQFWLVFFSFSQFFWDTLYVRLQVHFL